MASGGASTSSAEDKPALTLTVSYLHIFKSVFRSDLSPSGDEERPLRTAAAAAAAAGFSFRVCRLCAHGTGLVQSAQTQRVTVYLRCVCFTADTDTRGCSYRGTRVWSVL